MRTLIYLILYLLLSLLALIANAQPFVFSYFKNNGEDGLHLAYSTDGKSWTALKSDKSFLAPTAGKDKLMRDPCIIRGPDKMFYMVWTVSWNEKGIGYAWSKNLIHWTEQKYIPVMEHEPGALNCWAPEVFYDKKSKLYVIFWSTTIPGKFPDTDTSGDNGLNHRMYYVTTPDFKSFSSVNLFFNEGFNAIDGTLIGANGKYLLFVKDETRYPPQKNIRVAQSNNLFDAKWNVSPPVTGKYWAEGPTVAKLKNSWIVYFDRYTEHRMGAIQSDDLTHWTDISDQVSFPKGVRHGTVLEVPKRILKKLLNEK